MGKKYILDMDRSKVLNKMFKYFQLWLIVFNIFFLYVSHCLLYVYAPN